MKNNTVIISLVFLLIGFVSAYFVFNDTAKKSSPTVNFETITVEKEMSVANPFATKKDNIQDSERLTYLENELALIKQQLNKTNLALQKLTETFASKPAATHPGTKHPISTLRQRTYNLDNLIRGGINSSLAEGIVRRKSSIQLKRLALQDRATRENYLNTQQYFDELSEIDKQDVTLREELGDEQYDAYLFTSKQNNRIRISSVMLGSAAEQAGIQKSDIILSYDNNRLFNWQELKDATSEGQLGEYVSISINRKGEIFSFSVPRGPLGMQLGATRLQP